MSRIRSEALIGRRSSYIVLAIVYEWQAKDKRPQRSNVNAKNLEQNSQYFVEYTLLYKKRLSSAGACWRMNIILYQNRPEKLDKVVFGTPWLLDLLCKHWFASSVWNFCRWVTDVPPCETSPAAKSEEKRMLSQARQRQRARRNGCFRRLCDV